VASPRARTDSRGRGRPGAPATGRPQSAAAPPLRPPRARHPAWPKPPPLARRAAGPWAPRRRAGTPTAAPRSPRPPRSPPSLPLAHAPQLQGWLPPRAWTPSPPSSGSSCRRRWTGRRSRRPRPRGPRPWDRTPSYGFRSPRRPCCPCSSHPPSSDSAASWPLRQGAFPRRTPVGGTPKRQSLRARRELQLITRASSSSTTITPRPPRHLVAHEAEVRRRRRCQPRAPVEAGPQVRQRDERPVVARRRRCRTRLRLRPGDARRVAPLQLKPKRRRRRRRGNTLYAHN